MNQESKSLADEAKAAIAPLPRVGPSGGHGEIAAERVRAARSRLLPYVVVGGATLCGYLGVMVAGKDNQDTAWGAAVTSGIVAGMTVGWALLALYRRRVERSAAGRWRVDVAIVLLTVPAYVIAGWVSAWVGWVVAVALSRPTPGPGPPNAWLLLIAASVVIYPLSYAFARRDSDRPVDFTGALLAAVHHDRDKRPSWTILGAFLIGLAWSVGALFVVFGFLLGFQVMFREYLEKTDPAGPWLAIAIFVVWIGLTIAGTARTLSWIDRRRSRAS